MTNVIPNLEKAVRAEIEALHAFFVSWFGGHLPESRTALETNLAVRLDTGFTLIQPGGATLQRDELLAAIRSGYGSNPEFRIAIRGVAVRRVFEAHTLVTYEEW